MQIGTAHETPFSLNKANERKERAARKLRRENENQLSQVVKKKTLLVKHMAALPDEIVSSGLDSGHTYQELAKQFMEELNVRFKKQRAPGQEQLPDCGSAPKGGVVGGSESQSVDSLEDEIQPNIWCALKSSL